MKSIKVIPVLLLALISFLYSPVTAQESKFGVKGGLSASNFYINDVEDENLRLGFNVGVFAKSPLNDNLSIQTELLYTTAGTTATYDFLGSTGEARFKTGYLQLPILFNVEVIEILFIQGGLYGGYLLNASAELDGDFGTAESELDADNYNRFDAGAAIGAGLNFGNLSIGARYNLGFVELANSTGTSLLLGDSKNSIGQLYLAVGF